MTQPPIPDFDVRKFAFFEGPNFYLPCRAMVFNVYFDPTGHRAEFYVPHLVPHLPSLDGREFDRMADLFAAALIEALRLDINLAIHRHSIGRDAEDHVIAVEYVDDRTARQTVLALRDWLRAINAGEPFDWPATLAKLQHTFDRSPVGGPTIYSLYEAGVRRGIPVLYNETERNYQWGYGSRAVRGRSTVFHTDGVKDTEFTTFKDRVKDFLAALKLPVPQGATCDTEEEIVEAAEEIGYPVVVKPVAGHKGKGVSTNLKNAEEVAAAFRRIHTAGEDDKAAQDGVIVEKYIVGGDYRLLAVGGKFAAALHREPASVTGDGRRTIAELIAGENATDRRKDTIRSPLGKIIIDQSLEDHVRAQGLDLDSIPEQGRKILLRRIANISAGGVSINVTARVHEENRKLVEAIAGFFHITCLGIDVISADISRPWTEGNFGVIEINAGPGIFMHVAPAFGDPIDVPGLVMETFFPAPAAARIPIISGNSLSPRLCAALASVASRSNPAPGVATLDSQGGLLILGRHYGNGLGQLQSIRTILRHPGVDLAIISHDKDTIFDGGTLHEGANVVILNQPHYAEKILARDLLPGGILLTFEEESIVLRRDGHEIGRLRVEPGVDPDELAASAIAPYLHPLLEPRR